MSWRADLNMAEVVFRNGKIKYIPGSNIAGFDVDEYMPVKRGPGRPPKQ